MKKTLLYLVALLFMAGSAFGQERSVSGKITSDDAPEGLPGVNILLKGTQIGVISDANGEYKINVPSDGGTLVFTFIGYETQEVNIGTRSVISISMVSDVTQLSEVVVVGYGTQNMEALTGSIGVMDAADLEQVPMPSFEQMLQGNVAGLQSVSPSGQPGANIQIRIRGIGSMSASSEPLYVIDGIPVVAGDITGLNVTANTLAGLNPNDIEQIVVLKDASSTAIYGSRGANGVILITTKSGKSGKPRIEAKSQFGFNNYATEPLRALNSKEYMDLYIEGYVNRGDTQQEAFDRFIANFPDMEFDFTNNVPITDTNWMEEITRTGQNQSHDISVSGGTDNLNYFTSGSYFLQESPVIGSYLERYSSRLKIGATVSDRVKIENNLYVSGLEQAGMSNASFWANPIYNAILLAPTIPVKDAQGRFYGDHKNYFPMGGNNPVGSLSGDDDRSLKQYKLTDNFSIGVEIMPGLTARTQWNIDVVNINEIYFRNARYGDGRNVGGIGRDMRTTNINWNGANTLTYDKSFNNDHSITALIGYEAQKVTQSRVYAQAREYGNPELTRLDNAALPYTSSSNGTGYTFVSTLSRVTYDYKGRYFGKVSFRRDGSSRFGADVKYGNFWAVGAGWRVGDENFLSGVSFLDELKLTASYGVTGNAQGIGNFAAKGLTSYGFDYDGQPGALGTQIANPNLTWEQQTAYDIGLEFGLFNRVSGNIDYFQRGASEQILDVPISRTTGYTELTQNFGSMVNKGLELTMNFDVYNANDFSAAIGFNATFLQNEITKLPEEFIDGTKIRKEGNDFQTYFMYDYVGIDPTTGLPLWYKDDTRAETTSDINEATQFDVGKTATPNTFGGINANLNYKGISLSANFTYSFGNYVYYTEGWVTMGDGRFTPRNQLATALDRWQQPGDVASFPLFTWGAPAGANARPSTKYLYDGSFMRLRNLRLSYNLPTSITQKVGFSNVMVYAMIINPWTWTKDEDLFLDPEAGVNGLINSPVPALRTTSFGINIGL